MNILFDFIDTERKHYTIEDGNLFASSLGEALRYYDFLLIITDRYREISKKIASISDKSHKLTFAKASGKPSPLTDEQTSLYNEMNRLTPLINLEIESWYLFAKIFLDKIAMFVQDYFGQARAISLKSHDKWEKNHEQYRLAKDLTYPPNFSHNVIFLKELISDYRDKEIAHLHSQSLTRGIGWSNAERIRIFAYDRESSKQTHSEELPQLMQAIDTYIQQVITLVGSNRAKTRFKLKS